MAQFLKLTDGRVAVPKFIVQDDGRGFAVHLERPDGRVDPLATFKLGTSPAVNIYHTPNQAETDLVVVDGHLEVENYTFNG